jgi:hypothetical protein
MKQQPNLFKERLASIEKLTWYRLSRELKKPCIIGTKNATKILKDGQLIEVDAEKGIVRIVK